MLKPEASYSATKDQVASQFKLANPSRLRRLIKLLVLEPYRSPTPNGIVLLIFGLKLVLFLPFVNVPSVLRIQHQLDLAWNYLLVAYVFINVIGVAFTGLTKGSRNLNVFLLGTPASCSRVLCHFFTHFSLTLELHWPPHLDHFRWPS